jgi:two-component system sensor kinase FixL
MEIADRYPMGQNGAMAHEGTVPRLSLDELVDVIGALLVVLDTTGRVVSFNAACEHVTGYRGAEVVGRNLWDLLIPPEQADAVKAVFRALVDGEGPSAFTNDWIAKDGDRRCIAWSNTVSRRADGAVEYIIGTGIDMTDQLATEAALRSNRSLLQMIIAASPDAIITIDSAGIIESFNATAEKLFGYDAHEVIGRNVSYLMPEPYASEHDGYLGRYLATGERRIIGIGREVAAKRKDGTVFPIELAVGEVEFDRRKRFTGFIRDISRRREAEQGRAESDRRLAEALEGLPLGVILCDPSGRVTHINQEMRRFMAPLGDALRLGEVYEDLIRKMVDVEAINLGARKEQWLKDRLAQVRSPERTQAEFQYADGTWVLAVEQQTSNGETVALRIDITPLKQAEAALRASVERQQELQSEFHHVARLSAMGEMAATLAHELNQPLTAVINYVQACRRLLESDGPGAQKVPELIGKTVTQAHRAGEIISHLRSFVTRGDSERARVDINAVVTDACDLALVGVKAEGIEVTMDLADGLPQVTMDHVQIQQVIVNLVRNSVDALQDCERRSIAVRTRRSDPGHVSIAVADSGPGLDPKISEKLFEPFNTSKKSGMGIGLTVCRSIVQDHGGSIEAAPVAAGGVEFTVMLPLEG